MGRGSRDRLYGFGERGPSRKRFWDDRFMCNFVRFRASFSAFNSCLEMGDSNIPLLASRFDIPLLLFCGFRKPQLEFLGAVRTATTPAVSASLVDKSHSQHTHRLITKSYSRPRPIIKTIVQQLYFTAPGNKVHWTQIEHQH